MKFIDYLNLLLVVLFVIETISIVTSIIYYFKAKKLKGIFLDTISKYDVSDEDGKYPDPDYEYISDNHLKIASAHKKSTISDIVVFGSATIINIIILITEHHFYSFLFAGIMLYFLVETYHKLVQYAD